MIGALRLAGLTAAGLALLLTVACDDARQPRRDARRPNILLIVIDTLRADHVGAYGFEPSPSPRLDALAARGVRLSRFHTAAPSTLASFTSLLTGRYPHTHGVYRNGVAWPGGLEGVQSPLGEAGYRTAAFVASYCLSSTFGLSRGFDHFDERFTTAMDELPQNRLVRRADEVTDSVAGWLRSEGRGEAPFFAMVHYFDPHWPYRPPEPHDTWLDPHYQGTVTGSMEDLARARRRLGRNRGVPDEDSRHLHALHVGEIRYTDAEIGRLLDVLEQLGLTDETLVLVTADHGETFHEHPDYFDHGLSVYQTTIHVPLIAAGPGITGEGRVVGASLSNVDLAPTLLELAGRNTPETYEGRSFLPLLRGEALSYPIPPLFSEATKPFPAERDPAWPNRFKARAVLQGSRKLIHVPWEGDRRELYDLETDPGETTNLWQQPPRDADQAELRDLLDAWSARTPATLPRVPDMQPDVLERLRSLGYAN